MNDHMVVLCADCREELSARLDGEDDPRARAGVDAHLDACPACRAWFDDAARITRLARTGPAQPTPDLVDAVRAHAPVPRRMWLRLALRLLLALVGAGQLLLAGVQIVGDGSHGGGTGMDGATLLHFAHESAAWNLALGVGFVWVAWRVARAPGLVPTLTAFVVVLTALTGLDFASGHVDLARLLSHGLVLVGYAAVLALTARATGGDGFFPYARRPEDDTRPADDGQTVTARHAGSDDRDGADLRPTAYHDAA
jgi:predicted anti-sigma-YlaC factor YlaD